MLSCLLVPVLHFQFLAEQHGSSVGGVFRPLVDAPQPGSPLSTNHLFVVSRRLDADARQRVLTVAWRQWTVQRRTVSNTNHRRYINQSINISQTETRKEQISMFYQALNYVVYCST